MKKIFAILAIQCCALGCEVLPAQQALDFIQRSDVLDIQPGDSITTEFDGAKYGLVTQLLQSCDCLVDTRGEVCDTLSLFSGTPPFEIEHMMGQLALARPTDAPPLLQSGRVNSDGTFSLGFITPINDNDTGEIVGEGLVLMEGTIDESKMLFTSRWHIMAAAEGREADCEFVADYVYARVLDTDD